MTSAARAAVEALRQQGADSLAAGDGAAALRHWNQAAAIVVGLLRSDDATAQDHLALGQLCHRIGEALLDEGDAVRATAVLHRALLAHRTLEHDPVEGTDPAALVADVRLQLARAYELRGWAASALVEAQAGLTVYLDRWSGRATDQAALDVARALVWQGWTTMQVGDPDIAVTALDTSIAIHLGNAAAFDADPELSRPHDELFRQATLLSHLIHSARGRPDRAVHALGLLQSLDPALAERAERADAQRLPVAGRMTLNDALLIAGTSTARRRLLDPVGRAAVLTSAHRGAPDQVVLTAMTLHKAMRRVLDSQPAAARRILLEIHAMLAPGAATDWRLRIAPPTAPVVWVSTLMDGTRLAEQTGDRRLAADLLRWLQRVTLDLQHWPTDRQATESLATARRWMASRRHSPLALT